MKKKKSVFSFVSKRIVFLIVIIILVSVAINLGMRFIKNHRFFKLTRISSNYELDLDKFSELKGTSIFRINLNQIAKKVLSQDSYVKAVKVKRNLPDELFLEIEPRIPIARVVLKKEFILDEEGVLLNTEDEEQASILPLIVGLRYRIPRPLAGKNYNSIDELNLALSLIKEINISALSTRFKITKIDVSKTKQTSFYVEDGPRIKIGDGLFKERLNTLEIFLNTLGGDLSKIRYIDLRFKEPVVKFR